MKQVLATLSLIALLITLSTCEKKYEGDIWAEKAWRAQQEGKNKETREYLEKAITLPVKKFTKSDLHTALGSVYLFDGDIDKAEASYRTALSIDSKNYITWTNLGVLLKKKGMLKDAEKAFIEALNINEKYPIAHENLGEVYLLMGENKLAIKGFKAAVALESEYSEAHAHLAIALALSGEVEDAKHHYYKAQALKYKDIDTVKRVIDMAESASKKEDLPELDGDKTAKQALKILKSNDYKAAIPLLEQALKEKSNYYKREELLSALGGAYFYTGNLNKAQALLNEALKIDPNHPLALTNKALLLKEQGKVDDAISLLEQATEKNPEYAQAWHNLGIIHSDRHDYEKALKCLQNAEMYDTGNALYHANLALVLSKLGKKQEAEYHFEMAKSLNYSAIQRLRKAMESKE